MKEQKLQIEPRLLNEYQASAYLGISVSLLRKLRLETPKRFTLETFSKHLENGGIVPIPYLKIGSAVRYDLNMLNKWINKQNVVGELPNEDKVND